MTAPLLPIRVVALYRFTPFPDCETIRGPLALTCCSQGIKGTLLIAHEGDQWHDRG